MRVHELAKELGLTNKEAVDLCLTLGIDVKNHSSSIIDAQADRVRRRAERDGLVRDEQPDSPHLSPRAHPVARAGRCRRGRLRPGRSSSRGAARYSDSCQWVPTASGRLIVLPAHMAAAR